MILGQTTPSLRANGSARSGRPDGIAIPNRLSWIASSPFELLAMTVLDQTKTIKLEDDLPGPCNILLFDFPDSIGIDEGAHEVRDFETGFDLRFEAHLGRPHVGKFREHRLRLLERHDDDAIAVADQDIA